MIDGYVCTLDGPCPYLHEFSLPCCECEFCLSESDLYVLEHE